MEALFRLACWSCPQTSRASYGRRYQSRCAFSDPVEQDQKRLADGPISADKDPILIFGVKDREWGLLAFDGQIAVRISTVD